VEVKLDPPLQAIVDALAAQRPAESEPDLDKRRAEADATMMLVHRPEAGVTKTDHVAGDVAVRVLRPDGLPTPAPALFFIHGGGWFQGNLDTSEVECGHMATRAGCVVVFVDYRLAPTHPHPAALTDCVTAYRWVLDNAAELGIDTARIAIGGTSAGGNLAAAVCLYLRDHGVPMPILQLLDVPCLDFTLSSPSYTDVGTGAGLTTDAVREYVGWYLGADGDATDPYASPLHAADLSGLPPAFIVVAEYDPVRDDGERYLRALHAAGVAAACFRVLGHFHGGWVIPLTATSHLVEDVRASALRRAFEGSYA
jgi:acetyl esterase